ncbi:MAG: HAD-IC family P-type ATPase [Caloramator sp.]|nr:HAD-IC family P-type ATPase [Caloramator sp.]
MEVVNRLPGRIRLKSNNIYYNKPLAIYVNRYVDTLYGVLNCNVNYQTGSILVEFDYNKITEEDLINKIKHTINSALNNQITDLSLYNDYIKAVEQRDKAKRRTIIYGIIYILFRVKQAYYGKFSISRNVRVLQAAAIVTIVGGYPLLKSLYKKFAKHMPTDADILLKLTALSFTLMRESNKGVFVLLLKAFNDYIKYASIVECQRKVRNNRQNIINTAWLITEQGEILVDVSALEKDDIIIVHKGEIIPVEGEVVEGRAIVNTLYYTGQPITYMIGQGQTINEGMYVVNGEIKVKVLSKPKPENKKDINIEKLHLYRRIKAYQNRATYIALSAAGASLAITGDVMSALSTLLVLTPNASMVALNSGLSNYIDLLNSRNIYIRNVNILERAANIDSIVFDKTGTLTYGTMKIIDIIPFNKKYTKEDLLRICSACEINNFHPIAVTLKSKANIEDLKKVESSVYIPSKGISAVYDGNKIIIGNMAMMEEYKINTQKYKDIYETYEKELLTPVFVAINKEICGLILLQDTIRDDAYIMINKLRIKGIRDFSLLTGDSYEKALEIGRRLNIPNVYSECSIEDKLNVVQNKKLKNTLLMVGDGINDIPAMREADVSLSFCSSACDKVLLHSDCIILEENMDRIADFISLSQKTKTSIKNTIAFSKLYNLVLGGFAVFGYIDAFTAKTLNTMNSLLVLLLNRRIRYLSPGKIYIDDENITTT